MFVSNLYHLSKFNLLVYFRVLWLHMNCILKIVFSVLMSTINKLEQRTNTNKLSSNVHIILLKNATAETI